jgi:hypothetical protein
MRYAIFDTATGRVDRIIVAPVGVASASASCAPGEDFVAANAGETDVTHYVQAFKLVAFPPKPNQWSAWNWTLKAWQTDASAAWAALRARRARLLAACDWTQLPDAPITAAKKTQWTAYRQQLRDLTQQPDPLAIAWPQEPAA